MPRLLLWATILPSLQKGHGFFWYFILQSLFLGEFLQIPVQVEIADFAIGPSQSSGEKVRPDGVKNMPQHPCNISSVPWFPSGGVRLFLLHLDSALFTRRPSILDPPDGGKLLIFVRDGSQVFDLILGDKARSALLLDFRRQSEQHESHLNPAGPLV